MTSPADALIASYDGLICDLDGVVYRGSVAIGDAVATLDRVAADDIPIVFATNNASRTPDDVVRHLRELGLGERGWSVVTSAQAAAVYLAARLEPLTRVFAVGGLGVSQALTESGLTPVRVADMDGTPVTAVVQGLGVDVSWTELAEIGYQVQCGATWVATNLDAMLPTARGPAPGNGSLVAAVRTTTCAQPQVVGKPGPALYDLARARLGTGRAATLACGDRLDTDVEGANAAGLDSLLVLSGASRLVDVGFAEPPARPTYIAADAAGLLHPPLPLRPTPSPLVDVDHAGVPRVRSGVDTGLLLQAVVSAAWHALDTDAPLSDDADTWRELERTLGVG